MRIPPGQTVDPGRVCDHADQLTGALYGLEPDVLRLLPVDSIPARVFKVLDASDPDGDQYDHLYDAAAIHLHHDPDIPWGDLTKAQQVALGEVVAILDATAQDVIDGWDW